MGDFRGNIGALRNYRYYLFGVPYDSYMYIYIYIYIYYTPKPYSNYYDPYIRGGVWCRCWWKDEQAVAVARSRATPQILQARTLNPEP